MENEFIALKKKFNFETILLVICLLQLIIVTNHFSKLKLVAAHVFNKKQGHVRVHTRSVMAFSCMKNKIY
jgi:hypothetical protein